MGQINAAPEENKIRDTAISGQVSVGIDFCTLVVVACGSTQQFTFVILPSGKYTITHAALVTLSEAIVYYDR